MHSARSTLNQASRAAAVSRLEENSMFRPVPWDFPYHRLIPRSPTELRELRKFTANFGVYLASCVFSDGEIDHLFEMPFYRGFALVEERLKIEKGHDRYFLQDVHGGGHGLVDYLRWNPGAIFYRFYRFECLSTNEAALWVEKTGTARSLSPEYRTRLFGEEEASGKTKGRLLIYYCQAGNEISLWACAGVFTFENATKKTHFELPRAEIAALLRDAAWPMVKRYMPESFIDDVRLGCWNCNKPAESADVKR